MSNQCIHELPVPPQDLDKHGLPVFEAFLLDHILKFRTNNAQLMTQFGFIRSGSWVRFYREFTPEEKHQHGKDGMQLFQKCDLKTNDVQSTFHLEQNREDIDDYVYKVMMPWLRTSEVTIKPAGTETVWHWKK